MKNLTFALDYGKQPGTYYNNRQDSWKKESEEGSKIWFWTGFWICLIIYLFIIITVSDHIFVYNNN